MRKVVGLDISLQKTAVCVLDHDGQLVWQGKVDSEPGPLIDKLPTLARTRCRQPSKLRAWGVAVTRRRGAKRARVAFARKLAVIMHRMWVSGSEFRTGVERLGSVAA
jgi:predicted NBD/HSP70 family sugar kinase